MEKQIPTVGSQFTTLKSGVTGEVKEIVKNPSGSVRVRLDVKGQDRWTTVKQFLLGGLAKMSDPYARIILIHLLKNGVPQWDQICIFVQVTMLVVMTTHKM